MRRWALALVVATGCATGRLPRIPGEPPPAVADAAQEAEYQRVLEQFSAQHGLYDNLDTKVFFRATWQAPQFVTARMARDATFRAVPMAEASKLLSDEQTRLQGATEFFLAAHCNESKYDDFDRPNSMWRMVVVAGGVEYPPSSIERLGRTSVALRSIYSYLESFWVGYRVRFPAVPVGTPLTLKVSSALGKAELAFAPEH